MRRLTLPQPLTALLAALVLTTLLGCQKDKIPNKDTLKDLFEQYEGGHITQCIWDGDTVYRCGINAYDAGEEIFDYDGHLLGVCNPAWGTVDSICGQLTGCEVIYAGKNNIWGMAPVDKYNLEK